MIQKYIYIFDGAIIQNYLCIENFIINPFSALKQSFKIRFWIFD